MSSCLANLVQAWKLTSLGVALFISNLHCLLDDGNKFPVDLLLICIDGILRACGKVLQEILVVSDLLLQHVEPGDPSTCLTSSGLGILVEFPQTIG